MNSEVKDLAPEKHDQELTPASEEKDVKEAAAVENEEKEAEDKVQLECRILVNILAVYLPRFCFNCFNWWSPDCFNWYLEVSASLTNFCLSLPIFPPQEMTLEEYEKILEEKRKALLALKVEERKVSVDKELASMQQLSIKKDNDEIFAKLVYLLSWNHLYSKISSIFSLS